jgi:BlaR1 peptidase M56
VLAHELAHIQRSDYLMGLLARLALAFHFYHPMVRWMAARLLAQQELAADAIGARFAGGRGAYLAVLSRMALRQDGRISGWPARAFSPARGTLIRRIRMLKTHGEMSAATWSAWGRVLAVALLSSLTLSVWLLPRPLRGEDGAKVAMAEAKPERPATGDVPAFDLSYIPDDAMGVFAIHPAAIFRRKGMSQYADQLNALKAIDGLDAGLEIPLSKTSLKAEQIEQVTMGIYFSEDLRRLMAHCLMIRTTEPFDWHQLIRSLWPDATEVHEANRTYFKIRYPKLGKAPSLYVPDNRTVVCDEEPVIRRIIRRTIPTKPAFARETDWSRMEHDLAAVVLDNHIDQIRKATKRAEEMDSDDFFAKAMARSDRWVFGLANSDEFLIRAVANCHDSASARALATLVSTRFRETISDSEKPHQDAIPDHLRLRELGIQFMKGLHVVLESSSVRVESGLGIKLAEFLPLIATNGL